MLLAGVALLLCLTDGARAEEQSPAPVLVLSGSGTWTATWRIASPTTVLLQGDVQSKPPPSFDISKNFVGAVFQDTSGRFLGGVVGASGWRLTNRQGVFGLGFASQLKLKPGSYRVHFITDGVSTLRLPLLQGAVRGAILKGRKSASDWRGMYVDHSPAPHSPLGWASFPFDPRLPDHHAWVTTYMAGEYVHDADWAACLRPAEAPRCNATLAGNAGGVGGTGAGGHGVAAASYDILRNPLARTFGPSPVLDVDTRVIAPLSVVSSVFLTGP